MSDPLNNYFGRRGTIFFSAAFCTLSVIGSALTQNWYQLFVTRLLLGMSAHAWNRTPPPLMRVDRYWHGLQSFDGAHLLRRKCSSGCSWRSCHVLANGQWSSRMLLSALSFLTLPQWTAFGIFLGFCANLAVKDTGAIAWRLQLGSAFLPAVPLWIGVYFCPESPRWYIKKKRYGKAYASLKRLRNTELQAARDLYYIYAQIEMESAFVKKTNYVTRFIQLFTIPRVRRATLASFTVMLAQQMV